MRGNLGRVWASSAKQLSESKSKSNWAKAKATLQKQKQLSESKSNSAKTKAKATQQKQVSKSKSNFCFCFWNVFVVIFWNVFVVIANTVTHFFVAVSDSQKAVIYQKVSFILLIKYQYTWFCIWNVVFSTFQETVWTLLMVLSTRVPQNSIFHSDFRDFWKLAIQTLFIQTSSYFAYLLILKCSFQWLGLFLNFVSF